MTLVLSRQGICFPRDGSDKPYLILIFSMTIVLVIRMSLLMTEWTVLGKRVSVELLTYFSAGHVASERLNVFGLRRHVSFEAR